MKTLIKLIIVPILFVTVSISQATIVQYTLDNKIGEALLDNSGDETELQALADILNVNVDTLIIDQKLDYSSTAVTQNYGTTDEWVIDVAPNTPGWWLVKFGIGGTAATADTFYFDNIISTDATKLVFSDGQVQDLTSGNITSLSHYTTFNPDDDEEFPPAAVPEPGMVALFGMGLLGMGLSNLRRKRKAS